MNRLTTDIIKKAVVDINVLGGMRSIHVAAGDDSDTKALTRIAESIEYGWEQLNVSALCRYFLGYGRQYAMDNAYKSDTGDLDNRNVVQTECEELHDFELTFRNMDIRVEYDIAWATADIEIQAALPPGGRTAHAHGHETLHLSRAGGAWKIIRHQGTRQRVSKA